MQGERYRYKKLAKEDSEIRLLHLHAGSWQDQLSSHLEHVQLSQNTRYEALSYVWGDLNSVCTILLDDCEFEITKNLGAALRRLRKENEERVLWVDQLCINQVDEVEKSTQVALMPQIFKNCVEAVFWLGEIQTTAKPGMECPIDVANGPNAQDGIAVALDIIRQLESGDHLRDMACFQVVEDKTITVSPTYMTGLATLRQIMTLPYWERIWIVQENILPKRGTVVLGSCSAPWTSFANAAAMWTKHVWHCCRQLADSLPLEAKDILLDFTKKLAPLMTIARSTNGSNVCLFDVLQQTRNRKATKGCDKVFAVIGLVTDWLEAAPILPDYTLDEFQVYSMVAEYFINSKPRSLRFLMGNHLRRPQFPSWMVDWAAEDHSPYPYELGWGERFYGFYNACLGRPVVAKRHSASVMLFNGFTVDEVHAVGDSMEVHDWKSAVPIYDSWYRLTEVDTHPAKPYIAGGDVENALWRCVTGNVYGETLAPTYRKAVAEDFALYKKFEREMREAKEGQWILSDELLPFMLVIPASARNRRLFITKRGYIGMGPLATQVGDIVHVLLGSQIPFVSRKSAVCLEDEVNEVELPTFSFVGECYVHGVMEGEIILEGSLEQETIAFC
ncbi:uncharacterized protein PV09_05556 [Verruconis gallopava]|uniref:Heterokaryon incompatibility domain-containing protein n=1 Tax=Verruconis gallopava TaxID=253628 RepID=A0A0D1YRU9_9PEZI|nr:uncharacterized protein PV09_05556 [Verruconis gallopava]KIW03347.1 hypothetical protein PV09_05556 [Verruconis gallopava]